MQASIDKDRVGLNEVYLEFKESRFVNANDPVKKVYDGGRELSEAEKPYAIRLYAEGNMDHALGLAKGMKVGPSASEIFPTEKMTGRKVAIKATEFRSLAAVKKAYNAEDPEKLGVESATENNLEGSFGGKTGDMTRKVLEKENSRKYDLIQATFFWLQEAHREEMQNNYNEIQRYINQINDAKYSFKNEADKLGKNKRTSLLIDPLDDLWDTLFKFNKFMYALLNNRIPDDAKTRKNNETDQKIIDVSQKINRVKELNQDNNDGQDKNELTEKLTTLEQILPPLKKRLIEWIAAPWDEARNRESYDAMIKFVKNQLGKLKPTGEIRIVIANAPPYKNIQDELGKDAALTAIAEILPTPSLSKKYSEALKDERLNSTGFKHTQTFNDKEVVGFGENQITNDLIITVRPKSPEDASSPAQIPT